MGAPSVVEVTSSLLYAGAWTVFGRFGGALADIRPDDLSATALTGVLSRAPGLDPAEIDDVVWGCPNQAGEDNRDVGRMAVLLAGLPTSLPATTVNRLCGPRSTRRSRHPVPSRSGTRTWWSPGEWSR